MNCVKTLPAIALLLLTGCASTDWGSAQSSSRVGQIRPTIIFIVEQDDVAQACRHDQSGLGCAVRLAGDTQCTVFVKAGLSHAARGMVVTREAKHCLNVIPDTLSARNAPSRTGGV